MFSDIERAIVKYQVYKDAALAITKGDFAVSCVCIGSNGSIGTRESLFCSIPQSISDSLHSQNLITDKFVLFYSYVSNQSFYEYDTVVFIEKNGFDENSSNRDALINVTTNSVRIEKIFGYSIWVEKSYFRSYFFVRNDKLPSRPMVAVGMLNRSEHMNDASVVSYVAKVLSINPFD